MFWARVRRWFHCLLSLHRPVDVELEDRGHGRRVLMITCECNRLFGTREQ